MAAYSPTPPDIVRRGPHRSARKPEPSWPIAFVTANELVSRPSTNGGAPSSVAYSGSSGNMTEMPTELMKPMEPRTHRAGSIAPATRRTRVLSAISGGGFGVDGARAGSRRPASVGQEREGGLRGKQDDGGEQDDRLASGKAKGEERQEEEAVDRPPASRTPAGGRGWRSTSRPVCPDSGRRRPTPRRRGSRRRR